MGFAIVPWAILEPTRARVAVLILAYILHLAAAVVYQAYVLNAGGDALMYYHDQLRIYGTGLASSTVFVVYMVQFLREFLGGSLLDYFFFFQAFGFWGIAIISRMIEETYSELAIPQPRVAYALLFLPGLHFWTAAIGKDSLLFFAVALATWSVMRLRRRGLGLLIALIVMLAVRPHIALITLMSLAAAVFFQPGIRKPAKFGLLAVVAAGAMFVAGSVETTLRVDVGNANSVADFLASKSEVSEESGADLALTGASFPVKVLTLLFRPLFFDAGGFFGLIASFENLALIFIMGLLISRRTIVGALVGRILHARFAIVFFVMLTVLLAIVNYNVGLGLRQKMMVMPAVLILFVTVLSIAQARRQPVVSRPRPA